MQTPIVKILAGGALLIAASACAPSEADAPAAAAFRSTGTVYTVKDTALPLTLEVAGTAAPVREATLSTKLMGTVLEVAVQEGDVVAAGQPLVRIDARDLSAKEAQVGASVAEAEAVHRDALAQADRIRALYADSAATRVQRDAAETGLARAAAAVAAVRAAQAELSAVNTYAVVRAPFASVVTRRFIDPGAFAAPGSPLVAVQDHRRLRITVTTTPEAARGVRRAQPVEATIEGRPVRAMVEGVVPTSTGNLYTINALVPNPGGGNLAGSAATLLLPQGMRVTLVVPAAAITRQGDLTGVTLRMPAGDATRWVRLGRSAGGMVQVNAGLRAGDQVVVPAPVPASVAEKD